MLYFSMPVTIYKSRFNHQHDTGKNHPECAARIKILEDLFDEEHLKTCPQKIGNAATEEQIKRAHDEEYFYSLLHFTPDRELIAIDGDTILSNSSFDAALHAAGAVCHAVDDIMKGETKRAFCATRPPGHHAEPAMAMGFCLFNNVMIGAFQALAEYPIDKIAVIDFDVHHGNGSETLAYVHNDRNKDFPVFYASTHAYPLYPMTGDPADNGPALVNVRLEHDFDSHAFRKAYENEIFPALEAFSPDLLFISAGFDAHEADHLSQARLKTEDYQWITAELRKIADKCCNGRICSVLEGGYELNSLKDSVRAHLEELV